MAAIDLMEKTTVVDAGTDLAKAISAASKEPNILHFGVTNNGVYAGLVDDRVLRDFTGPSSTKVGKLTAHPKTVSPRTSDEDVMAAFLNGDDKVLPVIDDGKILGVVTRWGALSSMVASNAVKGKKISEYMTRKLVSITEETTISQARKTFKENNLFRVPVLDKQSRMTGVISTYDLAVKVSPHTAGAARQSTFEPTLLERIGKEPITSIMSTNVASVTQNDSLSNALKQMIERRVMGLVITEEGKPIGMLAAKDVMRACLMEKPAPIQIVGLKEDETMLKQSLFDECNTFLAKWNKTIDLAPEDLLTLHVKSKVEGKKKRFEVKSRLTIEGNVFSSRTPPNVDEHKQNWDLHLAVRESLQELAKIIKKYVELKKKRAMSREEE